MKKLYILLLSVCISASLSAQIDTVLFENFQMEPTIEWPQIPLGDDETWVNFDSDGLVPFDQDPASYRWFFSEFFYNAEDTITGEINYCIASLSYMEGFAPGNRNYLILPPIEVDDNTYTLHWKSAPFQCPRYLDGYTLLVSTTDNDLLSGNPFTDTLFQAASMDNITGDGQSIDLSNFTFTPGYIHADSLRDTTYAILWAPGDSTLMRGLLEPHSVSLAAYAGQRIYIAFLHDSDDDYYLALDDVLITRGEAVGAADLNKADLRFRTYPNPVVTRLNILYRLEEAGNVTLRIHDMQGRIVQEVLANQRLGAGEQAHDLYLADMPAGSYTIALTVDGATVSQVFVKR